MKAELRQRWIESLRSGYYRQARGTLRTTNNEFCCLGVLCDIWNPTGWENTCYKFGYEPIDRRFNTIKNPEEFVGLPERLHDELYNMNDSGASFSEIADWIEQNVPID